MKKKILARINEFALGENAVSYNTCKKWLQKFRDSNFNLQDKEHPRQKKIEDEELEFLEENFCQLQEDWKIIRFLCK